MRREEKNEWNQPRLFARVADSLVYTTLNSKELRSPTEYGICIRTTETKSKPRYIVDVASNFKCIACETGRSRDCWIAAMRLAKVSFVLLQNSSSIPYVLVVLSYGGKRSSVLSFIENRCVEKEVEFKSETIHQ
ncbi:hypothetical protein PGB90_003442 [Kerria lacca]